MRPNLLVKAMVVGMFMFTHLLASLIGPEDDSPIVPIGPVLAQAHGDILSCPYPGRFMYVDLDIRVIVSVETRWSSCWFPRENNNSFYRCIFKHGEGGIGGTVGGSNGGVSGGLAVLLGGGGSALNCSFVCPDGTEAVTPNPTGDWGKQGIPEGTEKKKCPSLGHVPSMLPYEIVPPDFDHPIPEPPPGEVPGEGPSGTDNAALTNPNIAQKDPNAQVDRRG